MGKRMDRRTFVGIAAAAAASLAMEATPFSVAAARSRRRTRREGARLARDVRFRQGVASGEPSSRGVTLWTRVDNLDRTSRLELEVASDRDFGRIVERRTVVAEHSDNFTVRERVEGLEPREQYFYRFSAKDRESDVGHFRTLPPGDSAEPVRIGFFSCQDWVPGFYTAHAGLAREDVDLVICLGDYVYERKFYEPEVREDTTGRNRDGEVQTLSEYRDKYRLYHTDENLREVRRRHSLLAIYDDHEVEDNWADNQGGGRTIDPRVTFRKRRRNGIRAFFEHMPVRAGAPARLYRSQRIGRDVELFLLNQRLYRNVVIPSATCPGEAVPRVPLSGGHSSASEARVAQEEGERTMLGARQKRWFKRALRGSGATWKVVANPVMIMALDLPPGTPQNEDQWDGFPAERRELLSYVRDHGIRNLSFMTGDIHTFFAGDVTPSGRRTATRRENPVATEFVCGSVTSLGIPDCLALENAEDLSALLADNALVRANNPHITWSDIKHRGYGVMEARRDELLVSFRAPATALEPKSRVTTLQRFHVSSGVPRVEVA